MRWGILGAAQFALEQMGPAIHAARGAELVALGTRDPAKAAAFQAFAPSVAAMDYEALIAAPGIDAIYVPLPNHLHVPWAIRALEAGKHVLVEKPAAMSVAELDTLIAARDGSGRFAAEAYMIVHHPQWQRARAILDDGGIGDLRLVTGTFSFDNGADVDNIRNQAGMGGGGLRDIGVYVIGSAQWAARDVLRGIRAQWRTEKDYDTTCHIQGRLAGAAYAATTSTRMFAHQEMAFHGTEGLMRLTAPFNPQIFGEARIELHQPKKGLRVERFPAAAQYVAQVEAFEAACDGAPYAWTLEQARKTQASIDAVRGVAEEMA